jgi:hypothetical protein
MAPTNRSNRSTAWSVRAGGEVHTDRHQCRVPALAFIVGDVLDRGAAGFTRKLCQPRLMDEMTAARLR